MGLKCLHPAWQINGDGVRLTEYQYDRISEDITKFFDKVKNRCASSYKYNLGY